MKRNISRYLIFVGLFLSISCKKDWLDAKSDKALTVPTTLSDFQGLMDDPNSITSQFPTLGEVASDGHFVADVTYQSATKNFVTDAYIWSHTVQHRSVFDYNTSYNKILICNVVLNGLEKIIPRDGIESETKNNIKGQALFIRAFTFFALAQTYTKPYNSVTAENDLGLVLRTSIDITLKSRRNTVKETYEQIIKDLLEAKNLLPDRPDFLSRASKTAVCALLSRVYLSMEDFDNSLLSADECLDMYSSLLDYNKLPLNANVIGMYNTEVLFHCTLTPNAFATTSALIDPKLYNLYDINDLRRSRCFKQNSDASISFIGNYHALNVVLFGGLATDEVWLTRAECYARKGNVELAMRDLNTLMKMRWDNNAIFIPLTSNNPENALAQILTERQKELILRGVRWTDLRRLNKDPKYAITQTRVISGISYVLEPNSYRYTFPMPDDIIELTGMQQNPEWQ